MFDIFNNILDDMFNEGKFGDNERCDKCRFLIEPEIEQLCGTCAIKQVSWNKVNNFRSALRPLNLSLEEREGLFLTQCLALLPIAGSHAMLPGGVEQLGKDVATHKDNPQIVIDQYLPLALEFFKPYNLSEESVKETVKSAVWNWFVIVTKQGERGKIPDNWPPVVKGSSPSKKTSKKSKLSTVDHLFRNPDGSK